MNPRGLKLHINKCSKLLKFNIHGEKLFSKYLQTRLAYFVC